MIRFPFFSKPKQPVAALYGDIVAVARAPLAYREWGVADDFEGRFERLILVATLVLRRLRALPAPAEAVGQDLVDHLFADLDDGLRRAGVGDLSVGKKMKKLAQGFYGRAEAYSAALESGDDGPLRAVLARNLFAGRTEAEAIAPALIAEIHAIIARLERADVRALLAGGALDAHYSP